MIAELTNLVTGKKSENFPGQYEGEQVLIFVRRHWMAFVGWIFVALIMSIIPVASVLTLLAINGPGFFVGSRLIYTSMIVCAAFLVTNAVFLTAWIEHYLDVAIITPERLIHVTQIGLFNRYVAELSLLRVQDVSARTNGYIETLLQYGQVIVESAGEAPNFVITFAPKPHIIANTILTLHDRLANADGLSDREDGQRRSTQAPTGNVGIREHSLHIREDLAKRVPGVHPPSDYHHDHFSENLVEQSRELTHKLQDEQYIQQHQQPQAGSPPSPNRLPPPGSQRSGLDEGDLEEGENISFDS